MKHLTEHVLESYELRMLAQPAVDAVEDHLLVCESCRKHDERVQMFIAALRVSLRELRRDAKDTAKSKDERLF